MALRLMWETTSVGRHNNVERSLWRRPAGCSWKGYGYETRAPVRGRPRHPWLPVNQSHDQSIVIPHSCCWDVDPFLDPGNFFCSPLLGAINGHDFGSAGLGHGHLGFPKGCIYGWGSTTAPSPVVFPKKPSRNWWLCSHEALGMVLVICRAAYTYWILLVTMLSDLCH